MYYIPSGEKIVVRVSYRLAYKIEIYA